MIYQVQLGEPAVAFLRGRLERPLRPSHRSTLLELLNELPLEHGTIFGFFDFQPSETTLQALSEPLRGTGFDDSAPSFQTAYARTADYLRCRFKNRTKPIALAPYFGSIAPFGPSYGPYFEYERTGKKQSSTSHASTGDPPERYVYLISDVVQLSTKAVTSLLYKEAYFRRICLLTSCNAPPAARSRVDKSFLQDAAVAADHILFSAYHGEAMLVWSRSSENPGAIRAS